MKNFHQKRLQRLQPEEQQLQFEEQRLQKAQLLEVLEIKEEVRSRIVDAKLTKIQLTDDMSESTEENELKDTLSQLSAASRGTESQRVTDRVHKGAVVENRNQSQINVADADPTACASVQPTTMGISLLVNPEGVVFNNANFDNLAPQHPCSTNNRVRMGLFFACRQ